MEEAERLPEPDEPAQEIAVDLRAAMEMFASIAAGLKLDVEPEADAL